ncbi:deazaflavin-dependent oxidoreductase (nitroreductase family) [Herbihabitans rhizosphaerae]|uniref:Deazaflavin-dependent oxidoreductase (Nitroreductase family) n=1 Tax=Herbihabitans rhizosphaerae TaxID=1872711 RepID=A0A4V2EUC9_9PSEU|nr:nitroreductase/quinone reductase family protein [Herbihabitans rhizosphaerae]RZS44133.1 deazaflavin-dependent oxidoreductase (nitroreductase family) [Herbihabitans rhizosphaerae]
MSRTTFSGRAANLLSTRFGAVARALSRVHERLYTRFGGTRFGRYMGRPVVRLTVRGRVSGEPRSVLLMLVRDGDDLLVCGSNGGNPQAPNWWRNLVAAGEGEVRVVGERWPVTARVVTDAEEHARRWARLVAVYPDFHSYQALAGRRLPIAVLSRRGTSAGR